MLYCKEVEHICEKATQEKRASMAVKIRLQELAQGLNLSQVQRRESTSSHRSRAIRMPALSAIPASGCSMS